MDRISVGSAVGSGFRLIRREPTALLIWFGLYLVYAAAVWGVLLAGAPGLMDNYLQLAKAAAGGAQPDVNLALGIAGKVMRVMPLIAILGLAFYATFVGAIYRAVLQPEARGFGYLRFGRQELWLLLSFLVLLLLLVAISIGVTLPFNIVGGIIVGVMAVNGGEGAAAAGTVIMLALLLVGWLLFLWIAIRLALALPIAFDQARFVVFEGWRASRGHSRQLFFVALSLFGIMLVVECVLLGALGLISGAGLLSGTVGVATLAQPGPLAIVWLALSALAGVVLYVIASAPLADVYRQLKGEDVGVF